MIFKYSDYAFTVLDLERISKMFCRFIESEYIMLFGSIFAFILLFSAKIWASFIKALISCKTTTVLLLHYYTISLQKAFSLPASSFII